VKKNEDEDTQYFITPEQNISSGIRVSENTVFFYGEIDEQSILELNHILSTIDAKLIAMESLLGKDCFVPTINLHIKTDGGCLFSAFAAIDHMNRLRSKIHTYVDGAVASAGTLIVGVGHRRYIGPNSHMLIHQLSSVMGGKYEEMENDMVNNANLMKLLKNFYKKYTKIPAKKLDELLRKDLWLSAEECVQYGIVDKIC